MKTIMFADWHMSAMCDVVVQSAQKTNRQYRFIKTDDIESAVVSLSEINPDLLIAQPSLLMQEDHRMLKVASALQPAPKLLVWWGNRAAFDDFKEQCSYPQTVSYVELPCDIHELLRQIDTLLA